MRSNLVKTLVMGAFIAFSISTPLHAHAQPVDDGLWSSLPPGLANKTKLPPGKGIYQLNHGALQRLLAKAPAEGAVARGGGVLFVSSSPESRHSGCPGCPLSMAERCHFESFAQLGFPLKLHFGAGPLSPIFRPLDYNNPVVWQC